MGALTLTSRGQKACDSPIANDQSLLSRAAPLEDTHSPKAPFHIDHLTATSSKLQMMAIHHNGEFIDDERIPLLSAEATTHTPETAAYQHLISRIKELSNGKEFLDKIHLATFEKLFRGFFIQNPTFNPSQEEIQIKKLHEFNPMKFYISEKLTVGNFTYKILIYSHGESREGIFAPKSHMPTQGRINYLNSIIKEIS